MTCVFCDIIRRTAPSNVIYEDEEFIAILDKFPIALGHTLVLPKKHFGRVNELSQGEFCAMYARVHALNALITSRMSATASHISINDGTDANQLVPHVHVHIIPRSEGDNAAFAARKLITAEEMGEIAAKLRVKNLDLDC